jgi:CelD/BcsL family acetyltransferase involved in cellulose biosynthesis
LQSRPHVYLPGIPFRRLELLASGESEEDEICSEYLGLIAERGAEEAVVSTLASALSAGALGNWDEILFPAMAGDGPIPELLTSALGSQGWTVEMKTSGACPYIALPRSWDQYLGKLSAAGRYVLSRSQREFADWAAGADEIHEAGTTEEVERGKRILKSLHSERWGKQGAFRSSRFSEFHDSVMQSLFAENALQLLWLTVRQEPVAVLYNVTWNGKVYFYQSGRKLDVPKGVRPGIVLHAHAIRRAIESGRREYDFLAGTSQYKRKLATGLRPLVQVRAVRAPLRELARRAVDRGRDHARRLRSQILAPRAPRPEFLPW